MPRAPPKFKSRCLIVEKELGSRLIPTLKKLNLLNKGLRIERAENLILVPLSKKPSDAEKAILLSGFPDLKFSEALFRQRRRPPKLADALQGVLPPNLAKALPKSMDFVGDLAVVTIPPGLESYKAQLGSAVLKTNKGVRLVLAKASPVAERFRLRRFEAIAGEGGTETVHKEFGCRYKLDLTKVYFNPRLSGERDRVAKKVKDGETVVDMFAGVGPFSILIARRVKNVKVYSIDVNPEAIRYLKENIILNKVSGKVFPILGDAKAVVEEKLVAVADRILMNLPSNSLAYVRSACKGLKEGGGTLHYYVFAGEGEADEALEKLKAEVSKSGRRVERVEEVKAVREVAPRRYQLAVDAIVV